MFNTYNPFIASGIVTHDLFQLLKSNGHNVRLLVNRYDSSYPEGIVSMESKLKALLRTILYKFQWRYENLKVKLKFKNGKRTHTDYRFFNLNEQKLFYKTDILIKKGEIKPDAIIILFVNKFINARNIYELQEKTGASILWLMYDMAPITGGCHYAWDCMGYKDSCGNCPGLFSSDPYDQSYINIMFKKNYLGMTRLEIIAASERQFEQASQSALFKNKNVHKVLLSVNPDVYKLVDKEIIRSKLNIPTNKKVLFFGSVGLTERRKGMYYLIESLKLLKQKINAIDSGLANNILLLIAGREIEQLVDNLPFNYHYMGMVNNTWGIASAYQAADLYICPSVEDSGPMMINQSIMCGTPVVSFEMGVAYDLVITGKTGYRAKFKDINDMALGILSIINLNSEDYRKMSKNCREMALKQFSPDVQIEKIESILKSSL